MGVKGTSSLPKVGLVLTSDVRHQPDHLVGADNREIRLLEVVEVVEVVDVEVVLVLEVVEVVVVVVLVEVVVLEVVEVVCCSELRLMSVIYQSGAEQSERADSPTFHLTQPVRSVCCQLSPGK